MTEQIIWDGHAKICVPDGFEMATIGEKRKMYGMRKDLPEFMVIDRENHVVLNATNIEHKEQQEVSTEKLAQTINYIYSRTVPGYKCRGIYKKNIDDKDVCVIQYTSYTLEDTLYTMVLVLNQGEKSYLLQCICRNKQVPEWHPIFRNIVESVKFKIQEEAV